MKVSEIPAVRIWPMSDKIPGFRGRSIEDVQQRTFLRDLRKNKGRFHYRSAGLNASLMIRRGNPKDEIIEEAEGWGADCIFLGAKGTRGVERLLLGSVSSAVSARARCSVEVVRKAE